MKDTISSRKAVPPQNVRRDTSIAAILAVMVMFAVHCATGVASQAGKWEIGEPIATYWAGPPMTDAAAQRLADGNWNLVWCGEDELDVVHEYGLRAQLHDGLLRPASLEDDSKREKLDALIDRVKDHPALYSYHITDEPSASEFPGLGKLVAYLREKDPAHLAYINLFPTYANEQQLGTKGDTVTRYREHLRQYVEIVKPDLISYDHYHFQTGGRDGDQYFLNLGMIRRAALDAGVPFLNIVQASSWSPGMRVPTARELRWLVYTSLAYGAEGISYFIYKHRTIRGGMVRPDGTPTYLYRAASRFNAEFVAIASELQPLQSLGAFHAGMIPPGGEPLPGCAAMRLRPPVPRMEYNPPEPLQGILVGYFAAKPKQRNACFLDEMEWLLPTWPRPAHPVGCQRQWATHALVVNLDYEQPVTKTLVGPGPLEVFRPRTGRWLPASRSSRVELDLVPGGGKLVRLAQPAY